MNLTKEDILSSINIINLRFVFKNFNSSHVNCENFKLIILPDSIIDKIIHIVNQNPFYSRGPNKTNTIKIIANAIARYFYKDSNHNLLFDANDDAWDKKDLDSLHSSLNDHLPTITLEECILQFPSLIPALSDKSKKAYSQDLMGLDDFVNKTQNHNFIQALNFFVGILKSYINKKYADEHYGIMDFKFKMAGKRNDEVVRNYMPWHNFTLDSIYKFITDHDKNFASASEQVNKLYIDYGNCHNDILMTFQHVNDLKNKFAGMLQLLDQYVKMHAIEKDVALFNKISDVINDLFVIIKNSKEHAELFNVSENKHLKIGEKLISESKLLSEQINKLYANNLISILQETKIFNHTDFIGTINNRLPEESNEQLLERLCAQIYSFFEVELPVIEKTTSADAIKEYAQKLLSVRKTKLHDLVLSAVATYNWHKLAVYPNVNKFPEFENVASVLPRFENYIFNTIYDQNSIIAELMQVLDIKIIFDQKCLYSSFERKIDYDVRGLFSVNQRQIDDGMQNHEFFIQKRQQKFENKIKLDKLIANYHTLVEKKLINQGSFSNIGDIETSLNKLYLEDSEQYQIYMQCVDKMHIASDFVKEQLNKIKEIREDSSLGSSTECCSVLARAIDVSLTISHYCEDFNLTLKQLHQNLDALNEIDQQINNSKLRFLFEQELIDMVTDFSKFELFTSYTQNIFDLYAQDASIAYVLARIAADYIFRSKDLLKNQIRRLSVIKLEVLPVEDAQLIRGFLNINIFDIQIATMQELSVLHNHLQVGITMTAKYFSDRKDCTLKLIASNDKRIVLEDFSQYSESGSEICGVFFKGPFIHFKQKSLWYQELQGLVAKVNYHLLCGDTFSVRFKNDVLILSGKITVMVEESDASSTFLHKILQPLINSLTSIKLLLENADEQNGSSISIKLHVM
jgi:hypothetical protein